MSGVDRVSAKLRAACAVLTALPLLGACNSFNSLHSEAQLSAMDRPSLKASRAALSQGQAETALSIARGVLSVEPKNVAALVSAGDADVSLGNRKSAEQEYRQALLYQPNYIPARLGLGKMRLRDNPAEAEAQFRGILEESPRDPAALTDLGVALDLQEHHAAAQASYRAALAINSQLTSTRVDMALSLALSGDPLRAEEMLRDATDAGAVPAKVRADYALAQVLAGHPDEATQTLQADLTADEARASVDGMALLMPPKTAAVTPAPAKPASSL
jgi:Flp pilus assembly protein TadD